MARCSAWWNSTTPPARVGIKPIIGVETYMAARRMTDRDPKLDKKSTHLLLLAENETGYKNLLKLVSKAQMEGFYYYPRIDHELLAEHSEGLICTSGCMSAEIPRDLLEERPEEAVRRMNWYYDVFGPDRFFIELQQHNIAEMSGPQPQTGGTRRALLGQIRRHQRRALHQRRRRCLPGRAARHPDRQIAQRPGADALREPDPSTCARPRR